MLNTLIVIPARLESKRLPRKVLLPVAGKPLIQHTWEQAKKTYMDVEVATDSEEIASVCENIGASCTLMDGEYRSGTARVAQIAKQRSDYDVYINWQADEPGLRPKHISVLKKAIEDGAEIATLSCPIGDEKANSPHTTKVVVDSTSRAMYFSRSRIPYSGACMQHVGIYAFRPDPLIRLTGVSEELSLQEGLEQLDWMYWAWGYRIHVTPIVDTPPSINTREDYEAFKQSKEEERVLN